jgi:hypothetical protein
MSTDVPPTKAHSNGNTANFATSFDPVNVYNATQLLIRPMTGW